MATEEYIKLAVGKIKDFSSLRRTFEELFVPQKKTHFKVGEKSGKVDSRALYRFANDKVNLFKKRIIPRRYDVVVEIIVDMSGSMGDYSKVYTALSAAHSIARALESIEAKCEVTGVAMYQVDTYTEIEESIGTKIRQILQNQTSVYGVGIAVAKEFDSRVKKRRLAKLWIDRSLTKVSGCFPEGEAVRVGVERVLQQGGQLTQRLVFIICDGIMEWNDQTHIINKWLKKAEKNRVEVTILGLGAGCQRVTDTYGNKHAIWVENVEELPRILYRKLKKSIR